MFPGNDQFVLDDIFGSPNDGTSNSNASTDHGNRSEAEKATVGNFSFNVVNEPRPRSSPASRCHEDTMDLEPFPINYTQNSAQNSIGAESGSQWRNYNRWNQWAYSTQQAAAQSASLLQFPPCHPPVVVHHVFHHHRHQLASPVLYNPTIYIAIEPSIQMSENAGTGTGTGTGRGPDMCKRGKRRCRR